MREEAEAPSRPQRPRREREHGGAYWLYGVHAVMAALANPQRRFRRLLLTPEAEERLKIRLPGGLQPEGCDRDRLEQMLGRGAVHQGIALLVDPLAELPLDQAAAIREGERNTILLLDRVTDPHNVGAVIRSAAAFGARCVVVTDRHAPDETATVAKAASGALERVPLVRVPNLARALDEASALGYWRIGLDAAAERPLASVAGDLQNVALVLGAEGEGLRRLTGERCDFLARLPMAPDAIESLNVSNAAAVALYALFSR